MPTRQPVAAGRFYPGDKATLQKEINHYLQNDKSGQKFSHSPWGVMLPHAGYIFCGDILGATLSGISLPENLIILCPNHTGYGAPLSVWPSGDWLTPLGLTPVNSTLAKEIIDSGSGFQADFQAHLREHSIEVILPFLQTVDPKLTIVPICIGTQNFSLLEQAASGLAEVISADDKNKIGLVVSSDMNHYEDESVTLQKDTAALNSILEMNPQGLLEVTRREKISMCGAVPMTLALLTAKMLGNMHTEIIGHTTSGRVNGDHNHVVGYAGVRIFENA